MTTTTPPTGDAPTFAALGLEDDLVEALREQGITTAFPIQEITLGLALQGADIIGQARTGTGKTLGFGLPMLQRLDPSAGDHVQVLVIVPTRELCVQVTEDLQKAGKVKGIKVLAVYGGKALDPQIDALRSGGVHVVVGTPGRLLDLMRRGDLQLSRVKGLVLDEADEMLDLGFLPDVEQLIQATSTPRQTLLFSATMPAAVVAMARRYMEKPTFMRADVEEVHIGPKTEQHFFSCHRMDKPAVLARILQTPERGLTVVFCRTKRMCDILAEELRDRGIDAAPIHSDLRQESREKALTRFREGKTDVLVATEVAARGLDIDDVTHVVNYDCPDDEKMYLHRIGRTGRAGAAGVAITLAVWNELARLNMIKKALDIEVETHEVFSTSPILDELFELPAREERPKPSPKPSSRSGESKGRGDGRGRGKGGSKDSPTARKARDTASTPAPRSGSRSSADGDDASEAAQAEERRIRRRKRGGRGRKRSDQEAPAAEPAAQRQPAKDDAGDDDGSTTRVRRRTRSRDDAADERPADTASASSGGDSGDSTDREADEGAGRTRTRTRTRSTAERPSGGRAGTDGEPKQVGDRTARDEARTRARASSPRGRGRGAADDSAKGDQQKAEAGDQDSRRGGERAGGGRSGSERSGGGRSGSERSGGERSSGGRSGSRSSSSRGRGGRGGGSGSGSRSGGQDRAPVSSDEARGNGQPRLRRPLEVAHLP